MQGNKLSVDVCVHGKTVREYQHEGQLWVEGRKSSEFSLRVRNQTGRRVLVVGSVDGLSIMDGKEADFNRGGYILRPFEKFDIPGWRLTNEEVAKFFFNKGGKSYAAQMGKPKNIGVIGMAVFDERPPPAPQIRTFNASAQSRRLRGGASGQSVTRDFNSSCMDCMDWMPSSREVFNAVPEVERGPSIRSKRVRCAQELGTGFGERHRHVVQEVPFEKATDSPAEVLEIRYDSRQGLQRRGIDLDQRQHVTSEPNAFPGEKGCQPPSGWNG